MSMAVLSTILHKRTLVVSGLVLLAVLPLIVGEYLLSISIITGIYVVMLSGLSIFLGYGGQFSFAQAVFYGIGAYTSALLVTRLGVPVWIAFAVSGILAGAIAFALSSPIIRLRGYYLAMATLAFTQIFHVLLIEQFQLTGGPTGVYGIPAFRIFAIDFSTAPRFHYFVWFVVVVTIVFTRNLMNSRVGRALKAIQASEDAATILGINTSGLKTKIFVLTGITGGIAGSLFAHYVSYIAPGNFTHSLSIWVVVILAIGGVRNIFGVVVGAAFTTIFPFLLGRFQQYNMLVFGIVLILVLKFLPGGISGYLEEKYNDLRMKLNSHGRD
jgi:branched-chain amino acid transport system permease protein